MTLTLSVFLTSFVIVMAQDNHRPPGGMDVISCNNVLTLTCGEREVVGTEIFGVEKQAPYGAPASARDQCRLGVNDCVGEITKDMDIIRCLWKQRSCTLPTSGIFFKLKESGLPCEGLLAQHLMAKQFKCVNEANMYNICDGKIPHTPYGYISTPSYPSSYPPNSSCTMTLSVPSEKFVNFRIISANMPSDETCKLDYLDINNYETRQHERFCDSAVIGEISPSFEVTFRGGRLNLLFHSRPETKYYEGFVLYYEVSTNVRPGYELIEPVIVTSKGCRCLYALGDGVLVFLLWMISH